MTKVFIDGSAGTTGLRIRERLEKRSDVSLITLSEELRKDENARREALNAADIAFLCLPDDAAREAVRMTGDGTVLIDTSTAHRTAEGWAYGFAELSKEHREAIGTSKRIANPGCHASGFIALVALFFFQFSLLYACISVGQLLKKHRVLGAVLAYIAWYLFTQILGLIFTFSMFFLEGPIETLFDIIVQGPAFWLHASIVFFILLYAALSLAFFAISRHMLTKKLNLE